MQLNDSTEAAYRSYLETRFFGCLDGLRFLCIAAVLFHHSPLVAELSPSSILATRGFTPIWRMR